MDHDRVSRRVAAQGAISTWRAFHVHSCARGRMPLVVLGPRRRGAGNGLTDGDVDVEKHLEPDAGRH
jgi:hypothetical protein